MDDKSNEPIENKTKEQKNEYDSQKDKSKNTDSYTIESHSEEAQKINRAQYDVNRLQYIFNRRQFYSNVVLNTMLVSATIFLTYYTYRLSVTTDALKEFSSVQIRPYIAMEDIKNKIVNDDIESSVTVKNVGISPAYNLYVFRISMMSPIINDVYNSYGSYNEECPDNSHQGTISMGPGDTRLYEMIRLSSDLKPNNDDQPFGGAKQVDKFSQDELNSLKENKSVYMVRGIACYKDIFKNQHYTKFCRAFSYADINSSDNKPGNACEIENESG